MGTIFRVSCSDCDYVEDEVLVGSGMAGVGYEAMVCGNCRRVVSVPVEEALLDVEPSAAEALNMCSVCGGDRLHLISLDEGTPMGGIESTEVRCPRSAAGVLNAQALGLWD